MLTLGAKVNTGWFLDSDPLRVMTMLGELTMAWDEKEEREASVCNDDLELERRRRARERMGTGREVGTLRVLS